MSPCPTLRCDRQSLLRPRGHPVPVPDLIHILIRRRAAEGPPLTCAEEVRSHESRPRLEARHARAHTRTHTHTHAHTHTHTHTHTHALIYSLTNAWTQLSSDATVTYTCVSPHRQGQRSCPLLIGWPW